MLNNNYLRNRLCWILALLCFLSLFLFIGQTEFNTRGEPREALVGLAMLEEGNWTLPITNGTDIAYKPPLFHWMIAAISTVIGEVNEYTSRMPSAIALAVMVLSGFFFYARRRGSELAFLMSIITLTNFEVHRAGTNCRVDMVLSALMVLAIYQLYRWYEKGLKGVPWMGILCLSGAFLSKGPVGLVLPCMVAGVFCLLRGYNFFKAFFSLAWVAIAACIIPFIWYYAAWKQGGDTFLNLVLEENVYRFLGKMTYTSHENPWHYNVLTLVTGFIPYTLLLLTSLFGLHKITISSKPRQWWNSLKTKVQQMDDTRLYSLVSIVIMFVFYCIPKSKRSVYLLPIYPFIAYFIAEYIIYLAKNKQKAITLYNYILCGLGIVLPIVFAVVKAGLVPHSIFGGRHAADNIAIIEALEHLPLGVNLVIVILPLALAVYYLTSNKDEVKRTYAGALIAFALFFSLDGVYLPAILNLKSNKAVAERIAKEYPGKKVYSFITLTEKGNRMHPFSVNFYLKNQVVPFIDFEPKEGLLILEDREYDIFNQMYGQQFALQLVPRSLYKSCDYHGMTQIYEFKEIEKQ